MRKYLAILITCIFFTLFITGCGEDEGVFRYTANGSYANQQLYLVMNDYYLWYYDVPQFNPTSYDNPSEVLEKMRFEGTYKNYQISDRWSFVMDYYEYVQFFEQGQYKGYGFMPIQGPNNNIWIAYLYDDSPLYSLGVKRGWKLEKIDNQTVTPNNYANLISISNEFTFRDHNDSIHKIN